jgi:hypothetical protein
MIRYSELSKTQKAVIDGMRLGGKLYYDLRSCEFSLLDERGFNIKVKFATGHSLESRNFVLMLKHENDKIFYQLNPDIS